MNSENIKNIIFDLGNVLIDIEIDRTFTALSEILGYEKHDYLPENIHLAVHSFEIGAINQESFIWRLQKCARKEIPSELGIINAWNAMLIGWNPDKFQFLLELRKKYIVFLLSNTNEIHLNWVYQDLQRNHCISDFDTQFFHKAYYSHIIGLRKPDPNIFDFVINDQNIKAADTLFIDDLKENVDAAKSVGLNGYHHNPKDDIIQIFKRLNK